MVDSNRQNPDPQPPDSPTENLGLDQFESIADGQGISLDELSKAYAELVGKLVKQIARPKAVEA